MGCCLCITSGPNRALIKSGSCVQGQEGNGPMVIGDGGCICVLPFCQTYGTLDLTIKTVTLESERVLSKKGVNVTLHGVAQVRINKRPEMLSVASAQFLGIPAHEVTGVVERTMEGHQRAIIGAMTMEQLYSDRHEFANQVREVCKEDMLKMGMEVVSYVITIIKDDNNYFESLGVARIQEVIKNAEVGKEKYTSEVQINKAMCNAQVQIEQKAREQEANEKVQAAKTVIAEQTKNFKVKDIEFNRDIETNGQAASFAVSQMKAKFDAEINTLNEIAKAARVIQETKQKAKIEQERQAVVKATKAVEVEEKEGATKVEEVEVKRKEQELKATVEIPATAKKTADTTIAEGQAAVKTKLAEGEASKIQQEADARAHATKVIGTAEAEIIGVKGESEATAMSKKADAWAKYTEGAYVDMILKQLPEIATNIAAPLAKTDKIVMISNGGEGGSGAAKLTKEITSMVAELPEVARGLTGVDIKQVIKKMSKR